MSSEGQTNQHRRLVASLLVIVVGAFGFGYALVPLYEVFCEITGFGGRTNPEAVAVEERPDFSREVRIEFMTTVNSYAPFEFSSDADSMTVNPGRMYFATFTAKNMTVDDKVAHAVLQQPGVSGRRREGHAAPVHRRPGPAGIRRHDHTGVHFLRHDRSRVEQLTKRISRETP